MSKRSQSIAILATVAGVIALAWALTRPPAAEAPRGPDPGALDPAAPTPPRAAPRVASPGSAAPTATSPRPSRVIIGSGGADDEQDEAAARERAVVLERAAKARAARDARDHGEPIEIYSDDPTNQAVLGPGRWMAQPPESVARALDDAIDASPAPAELDRQRRVNHAHQTARAVAADAAAECVSLHAASLPLTTGRVLLDLSVSSDRGQARVDHVSVTSVVDIDHPDLRTCLTSGLTGATFPAQPLDRPLAVRVPLFFRDGRPSDAP
jgi:hypothetical protein